MTMEKARKLALNKLQWQVANGYRKNFTHKDIDTTANQFFYLHNAYDGRDIND